LIEARGLTKRYGSTTAVEDLSFEVLPGRVTGFLGPNCPTPGGDPMLSAWLGLGVFFLYALAALGAAAFTLVHRDA
jgi:hypothetical protein